MKKKNKLREELAELEHEQWMSWSKYIVANNEVPLELFNQWSRNWKPYSKLSEKQKDKDRIWADKVIKLLIEKNDNWEIGRFTIVQLTEKSGLRAVGISRKSHLDRHNNRGLDIARGRAERALTLKKQKKLVINTFMG